jgi:hypothetical protein
MSYARKVRPSAAKRLRACLVFKTCSSMAARKIILTDPFHFGVAGAPSSFIWVRAMWTTSGLFPNARSLVNNRQDDGAGRMDRTAT